MNIRKLSAINSTNEFLKELCTKIDLENFTVISADFQTNGKGQTSNKWYSDKGKNLLFSILINDLYLDISKQAYFNFAISIGIHQILTNYLPQIKIKWPNDIMAGKNKICGILIENTIKKSIISQSIIGIGLNVNQLNFPDEIPNATSFIKILNKQFDRDQLLLEIFNAINHQISYLKNCEFNKLKTTYESVLFKKDIPSIFKYKQNTFLGKIVGVTNTGLLQLELETGELKEFYNKELIFL